MALHQKLANKAEKCFTDWTAAPNENRQYISDENERIHRMMFSTESKMWWFLRNHAVSKTPWTYLK